MNRPLKTVFVLLIIALLCPLTGNSSAPFVPAGLPAAAFLPADVPPDPGAPMKARAEALLAGMTLEEKLGQLFLAHCPGENAAALIKQYKPGGLILFAADFADKSPAQAAADIRSWQESASVPLLIGVDEEGGTVNRISKYPQYRPEPFRSPQALYAEGGWTLIEKDTIDKARLLKALGVNLNLAPVCDVTADTSAYIYPRTFGLDAVQTAVYAKIVVSAMVSERMGCALKHFPGYGSSGDTHAGEACDDRGLDAFTGGDFLPFEAGLDAGAGAVLVSHTVVSSLDGGTPSSLSLPVHRILRSGLGFDGVILTDDLSMAAVRDYIQSAGIKESAAVLAVLAGNDLLCCPDIGTQLPALLAAVQNGTIPERTIDAAVGRILLWKLELGIAE